MHKLVTMRLRRMAVVSSVTGAAFAVAVSAGPAVAKTASAAASGCGAVPKIAPADRTGVLAKLGSTYTSQFDAYPTPIYKSDYANFKPKGKPPYTVGVDITAPISPTQAALAPRLEAAIKKIPGVKKVILETFGPTSLTTEIQQVHSLIQQHVNFIVTQPLVPQSFVAISNEAKAAGIPFISTFNSTPSAASINIVPNSVGDALDSGALLAKAIHGKGLVVGVHGVPGTGVDTESFTGWKEAFAQCPGITFDGSVVGEFQPSVAESAMASYLSTHPAPIAGVVESAGMTSGIIQAFQQAGRPLPVFVDAGETVGDVVFFKTHKANLASAFTITPAGVATATAYTIKQLIAGHGPKVSELASLSDVITPATISKFGTGSAPSTDANTLETPWDPTGYLAKLFNK
jgi:ribose transport system substrate-binding protein